MNFDLTEWLHLLLRWAHVFAGILWIGSTYFFTWLDGRLHDPAEQGQVWMVHSGGFYVVEKQNAPSLERTLHWFRWEAAFTWLSGIVLLFLVYHFGGALIDKDVRDLSLTAGIGITVGLLLLGWLIYDRLWSLPLPPSAAVVVSYLLLVAITYGLTRLFSGRAVYIHIGALLGTLMAANVWRCILPAQQQLIAATKAGGKPDPALAARAKMRSKHNTFMVLPLVFIMISNHFPTSTFGSDYNWMVLAVLVLAGWGAAKVLRRAG